jgi:hypothetical protein
VSACRSLGRAEACAALFGSSDSPHGTVRPHEEDEIVTVVVEELSPPAPATQRPTHALIEAMEPTDRPGIVGGEASQVSSPP